MKKEELKDLVKSYFNLEDKQDIKQSEEITKETFAAGELIDGTKVNNGSDKELEVGDSLFVETEAGETVDAPSGEHEMKDGTVVVVDGEGKITGLRKPDETGQGSLAEELPDSGPAKILNSEELSEETEVELADNAIAESGDLPMAEHGDEEEAMEEHGIKEEIIEAIMGEIAPMMDEMKAKLAEHEEKMKEHYSSAASESVTEKAFSKAGFGSKSEGDLLKFGTSDLKAMQYENVLSRASKNN
tara:strand:+ start:1238 stop:1969 length:732 start_codon:yes stop_codon:yes gene_type:complete